MICFHYFFMCGITGFFNTQNASEKTIKSLTILKERGIDACGLTNGKKTFFALNPQKLKAPVSNNALGHVLHSVVSNVKQPLKVKKQLNSKSFISANCEIYNWKFLKKKHSIKAENDSELLLKLLEKNKSIKTVLNQLDGVWAFAFWKNDKLFLSRDLLGEKPLWYSLESGLAFASEKKALRETGFFNLQELNPRNILVYDLKTNKTIFLKRPFFKVNKEQKSFEQNKKELLNLLESSVKKRVPDKEFGLLFSGGIDSLILAVLFKKLGLNFRCFFAHVSDLGEAKDLRFAKKAAKDFDLKLEIVSVKQKQIISLIKKIVPLIESSNPVKVGVALPLFAASQKAKKKGLKVIFSGLGADELFCGYSRFKESNNVTLDSINLLLQMHENDLYRDDLLTMENNLELRLPFLDLSLIKFALGLSKKFKLSEKQNKIILRAVAENIGIVQDFSQRKKTAAQYGSNFDKALEKLAKQAKFKGKSDYLAQFSLQKNLKLASLFSGGKDSHLSLWIMQRQNYEISCLVSVLPKNPDSYMFQKPVEKILKLQSNSLKIPLITEKTLGKKEKELIALKKALIRAKKEFGIQGVVSGALFSNYQRERIQKICNDLQLRLFSPLWHKKQEKEMLELLNEKFEFVLVKIAGFGLNKSWLGKTITKTDLKELEKLNKKFGFNVAGEGGEFESLVLNAPNYSKSLKVFKSEKIMQNEFTGELNIKKIGFIN